MNAEQTMAGFAVKHGVTMFAERIEATKAESKDWPSGASHWRCVLACDGRSMEVRFHQGPALTSEPTATDLLNCIASDSAGYESAADFADWCSEYGYDEDSRKAEATYNACRKQAEDARAMLGDVAYEELLYETEQD